MKTPQIPHADSIEELAQFWDTHDLTDFEDQLEVIAAPVVSPVAGRGMRPVRNVFSELSGLCDRVATE